MIPPVPLIVRMAMSFACLLVSKAGFTLAGWITPEVLADEPAAKREGRS